MAQQVMREMELANFVCKFGDKNLSDYLDRYFVPALMSGRTRKYGRNNYILQGLEFTWFTPTGENEAVPVCFGRLVKNTVLSREQIFEQGKIIKDQAWMDSAPSSIFVLVMDVHRLLFAKETNYAPSMEEFAHTVRSILSAHILDERRKFAVARRAKVKAKEPVDIMTDANWAEMFPKVEVRATAIASQDSLQSFLQRFGSLKTIKIKMLETNHEVDWSGMFSAFRESAQDLKSERAEILYRNTKEGLDTEVAQAHISEIASQANHEINLNGVDKSGNVLKGDNEHLSMKISVPAAKELADDAKVMLGKFIEIVKNGAVVAAKIPQAMIDRARLEFKKATEQSPEK